MTSSALRARLVFVALTLVVIEGSCQLYYHERFAPFGTSIAVQGRSRWRDQPALHWDNRPRYLEQDASAQYNDLGMRVRPGEVALPTKGTNDFWVFLLGGSAMAGVGSAQTGDWLKLTGIGTHSIAGSIDGQLEALLRERMPGRHVSVFNCAVAWYTLGQSRQLYATRLRALRPDWVISLDGANDPTRLAEGESSDDIVRARWRDHPTQRWPMRVACLLMSHSGAAFGCGEYLFFRSGLIRSSRNTPRDPALVARWLAAPRSATVAPLAPEGERAAQEFVRQLDAFDRELESQGQRHLLLVQPELSLRVVSRLESNERALYNYYLSLTSGTANGFMSRVHELVGQRFQGAAGVASLAPMHAWSGWTMLDNCHLTQGANGRLAAQLAEHVAGPLAVAQ